MADEQSSQNSELISEIGIRLRDIEEKQNIIKDRVLLIGENLVSEKNETNLEIASLKSDILKSSEDIKKIKLALERIIDDENSFVRRNEFEILQRQFDMFQPLQLARIADVEDMIKRALKNK